MKKIIFSIMAVTALTACSQEAKKNLGLVNTPPDEFSVVTRAPLAVPPDFTLRAPQPGAARPMEESTQAQARRTIFGEGRQGADAAETDVDSFLSKVGVNEADPNIRQVIDSEKPKDTRTTAERLLFLSGDGAEGDPLDPEEELQRLRQEGLVQAAPSSSDEQSAE